MATNPVNLASNYVSQVQPQPQSPAERVSAEKVNEKVRDDAAATKAAADEALKQTVNTSGQAVGSVINVKA
ncbi:MAG: hypothetical protein HZB95_03085 [Nitrosomonadales bacterium]|nr:hypothetical protein [Nitrosomonadales bacterium]